MYWPWEQGIIFQYLKCTTKKFIFFVTRIQPSRANIKHNRLLFCLWNASELNLIFFSLFLQSPFLWQLIILTDNYSLILCESTKLNCCLILWTGETTLYIWHIFDNSCIILFRSSVFLKPLFVLGTKLENGSFANTYLLDRTFIVFGDNAHTHTNLQLFLPLTRTHIYNSFSL